jgi:hypothetical protein
MKFIIIFITLFIIYFWVKEQIKEKKITNSINENILKKKKIHKQEVASRITIKEMYSYFHFFAFSKSLNMAVVQAFKDVDILRTIYTYDSFPVVSSGLFSPYLYKEKRIESTMKSRGNGILEVEYNGGVINLEEELHTINPFLKMIELKIYDGNKDLNSIYSILFFVEGIGEKIHQYVITNEIDANKKKVLSIDSEGYSLLIKTIKNDEFNIRNVINEIASEYSTDVPVGLPLENEKNLVLREKETLEFKEILKNQIIQATLLVDNPMKDTPMEGLIYIEILGDVVERFKKELPKNDLAIQLLGDKYEIEKIIREIHTFIYNKIVED